MYLTKREQSVLESLPSGGFSVCEVARKMPRRYLVELLARLVRKKKITRLGKGRYFVGPIKPERMALALEPRGYIGFASALKRYGLLDEELSRVFVATLKRRGRKVVGAYDVVFVPLGEDFYGIAGTEGPRVSTRAKTFFDCFKKPFLAGGFWNVLEALKRAELTAEEWREWLYYLEHTKSKSLKQRTGFLLEGIAPEWFLKKLGASIGRKVVAHTDWGVKGFNKKWGVCCGRSA